ncbi:hypothetical protein RvY_09316-2 [Ramazzottius varieornatus]|uniref:Nuclear receptor 2C2-associated protein n=1 Tax=Ramazzottius varieornatus TaxID=947166 RepID=A0A1D1V910_RAMVA|nr:hypothetical protein RvY_09316-2 [Ramazzottius varieornatus]
MPDSTMLIPEDNIRVSSVLHGDSRQYGKQNMFDGSDETCWHSDQGPCQWVLVRFQQKIRLEELRIQFQGGFAARQIILKDLDKNEKEVETFWPDDNNSLQSFPCLSRPEVSHIKVHFDDRYI